MNAQLRSKKGLSFAFFIVSALIFSSVAHASVKRVSLEKSRWDGENRYLDVSLTCSGDDQPRLIRRAVKASAKWCSVDAKSLCHRSKYTLARAVCKIDAEKFARIRSNGGDAVAQQVKSAESISKDAIADDSPKTGAEQQRTELLKEQMLIEEQRIEIEQQRLKLIAQEIELRKSLTALVAGGD